MKYSISEANWKDLPNIRRTIASIEASIAQLQEQLEGLQAFEQKLSRITEWKDGYPYSIRKEITRIEILNLELNYLALVYQNAQDNTKWGVNTKILTTHGYVSDWQHKGHDFTLDQATEVAYNFAGYGILKRTE